MRHLLILLLLAALPATLLPCSCAPFPDTFCEVLQGNEILITGEVLSKYVRYQDGNPDNWSVPLMDVKIETTLAGEPLGIDTISLVGQDGLNCNAWIGDFEMGQRLLIAIPAWSLGSTNWYPDFPLPNHRAFPLFGCGQYFLNLSANDQLSGPIRPGVNVLDLSTFISELDQCLLGTATVENQRERLRVFPNPATDRITLDYQAEQPSVWQVFHAQGQLLETLRLEGAGQQQEIDIAHWPAGVYWLRNERGQAVKVVKI
ncbi:MAG: T9SS type A sorting domain-containing protein [Lewinella sp.]|nr:T9SS type A sorting domain-containing protein [Lewinella sp.]